MSGITEAATMSGIAEYLLDPTGMAVRSSFFSLFHPLTDFGQAAGGLLAAGGMAWYHFSQHVKADIVFVGLQNSGKSTLLNTIIVRDSPHGRAHHCGRHAFSSSPHLPAALLMHRGRCGDAARRDDVVSPLTPAPCSLDTTWRICSPQ